MLFSFALRCRPLPWRAAFGSSSLRTKAPLLAALGDRGTTCTRRADQRAKNRRMLPTAECTDLASETGALCGRGAVAPASSGHCARHVSRRLDSEPSHRTKQRQESSNSWRRTALIGRPERGRAGLQSGPTWPTSSSLHPMLSRRRDFATCFRASGTRRAAHRRCLRRSSCSIMTCTIWSWPT